MKARFVNGPLQRVITVLVGIHIFLIVLMQYRNLSRTRRIIASLKTRIRQYRGPKSIQRLAYVDGGFYWDMYAQRWPSNGFVRGVKREAARADKGEEAHVGLRTVLFGVTTKCALRCEHCYEWDNLNTREKLSLTDLERIVEQLLDYGAAQIHLGGGEPMMRFDDVAALIAKYQDRTSFWIVTSGFHVTRERAQILKQSGLTGLCVSIDHHVPEQHNAFRHYDDAFAMAQGAVAHANAVGLVTSLSLCTTREYASRENMLTYLEMAKRMNVSFVQILEPRSVGHYEGKDVYLETATKQMLGEIFLMVNNEPAWQEYPVVIYHEYYRNTMGCRGAGAGSLYIDPLGGVHACPFCRNAVGNLVIDSVRDCVDRLRSQGCHVKPLPEIKRQEMKELVVSFS
jgi:MoaA/NifB/PqqE/SkfB family radical SAM enzyme